MRIKMEIVVKEYIMKLLSSSTHTTSININNNFFIKIFFIILFLELFLMGSGRSLEFGSLTMRMLLYGIALIYSMVVYLHYYKIHRSIWELLIFFTFVTSFSSLIGILNGADISLIFMDIKPLLYFLMILPFALVINSMESIKLISKLIKYSAIIMAVVYLLWFALMLLGYLDFGAMYVLLSSETNEIMFRGSDMTNPGLFYKGFVYMCIGFIFFINYNDKKNNLIAILLLFAIFLTFTRGFIVALALAFLIQNIIDIKQKKSFTFVIIFSILLAIAIPAYMLLIGSKGESDQIRITQIMQVLDNINIVSLFIGHGFGIGIPIRPNGMEISYLEIFHKQGLLGLILWFSILFHTVFSYIKIKVKTPLVKSLLGGSLFIFMQSLTNPFINNPIGMSMILISLLSLQYIYINQKVTYA